MACWFYFWRHSCRVTLEPTSVEREVTLLAYPTLWLTELARLQWPHMIDIENSIIAIQLRQAEWRWCRRWGGELKKTVGQTTDAAKGRARGHAPAQKLGSQENSWLRRWAKYTKLCVVWRIKENCRSGSVHLKTSVSIHRRVDTDSLTVAMWRLKRLQQILTS